MLDMDVLRKDEIMKDVITSNAQFVTWVGNRKRIICYAVDFGRQMNILCTHPQELSDGAGGAQGIGGKQQFSLYPQSF